MVIEQPDDPNCLANYYIVEILLNMGWQNIFHFGGSACLSLVDLMSVSIEIFTPGPLSCHLSHRNKTVLFNPTAISILLHVSCADKETNPFDPHMSEEERLQIT